MAWKRYAHDVAAITGLSVGVFVGGLVGCEETGDHGPSSGAAVPAVQTAAADQQGHSLPCCPLGDQSTDVHPVASKPQFPSAGTKSIEPSAATQPSTQSTSVSAPAPAPGDPPNRDESEQHARAGQWLDPASREAFDLDFKMTDQDSRSMTLEALKGKPIAMSFIFTRCPNPEMCPLIVTTLAKLQRDLEEQGLGDQVWLALLSYDPVFDTPQRLKRYGQDRGLRFTNAKMLRPDPDQFRELLHEFQIGVHYNPDGSIGHFIELLLIDRHGRFVRDYQGDIWDNAAVLEDLKTLAQEKAPASLTAR